MGKFLIGGWELILPVCSGTSALDRGATLTARWLHEPREISNHPVGLEFQHTPGRYRPGVCALSSYFCLGCTCISEFLTRRCGSILPVCGGTSALDTGATIDARGLHEPRAISNHPAGLCFSHTPGRYRPGGCAVSSPRFLGCIYMGEFLSRRWELILPVCGGTSTLDRGATHTTRWLHEPRESSITQWDWGFHILRGGIDPEDARFRPHGFWVEYI